MAPTVLVIGLDGGTFNLIKPFIQQGFLTNIHKLMSHGTTRVLKSTIPPVSPPAWTSFLTGINPGGHSIFQFVEMDVKDYSFTRNRLINSTLYSGKTFIDSISNHGLKVGIVKIPFTYPPWPVNGIMIAGEPSPDWKKAHTYPPELAQNIGRVNKGSATDFLRYNTQELLAHLKFDCHVRTQLTRDLMKTGHYDFFMMVHNVTDAAIHRFWKFTDTTCPNYKGRFKKHEHLIREVYQAVDDSVGQILNDVDDDTTVFLMSDHGATRKPLYFFHINAWLRENGYLKIRNSNSGAQNLFKFLAWMKGNIPPLLRQVIMRILKSHFQRWLSKFETRATNFQWDETKAYAVNLYTCIDGIAINLKGRQEQGIVEPGATAEKMCCDLKAQLLEVKDPRTNTRIIKNVFSRHEVFIGPYAQKMPELILEYAPDYRSGKQTNPPLVSDVPKTDFDFQSGDHDPEGIFIATGTHIKPNCQLSPATIQDMAPTLLYAMGLPVPDNMDGQVMTDIFDEAFVRQHPVHSVAQNKERNHLELSLSQTDEDEMIKQLKGLGYM